ncbi:MAG: DUF4350 domain-containing protein [bacterium]
MNKRISIAIITLLLLFLGFSAYKVLEKRFTKGDIYPLYSSLRHDPIGTSILFQTLTKIGYTVDTLTDEKLSEDINPQDTILFILTPSFDISEDSKKDIVNFIQNGGRVFLTVTDSRTNSLMDHFDTKINYETSMSKKDTKENEDSSLFAIPNNKQQATCNKQPTSSGKGSLFNFLEDLTIINNHLSLTCDWPNALTVYSNGNDDIILLLKHGKGDIVISSEAFFISNESLSKKPPLLFLKWLLNQKNNVIIDEYHHGLYCQRGISFLLKKYHLYWFMLYLIIIFILYLWHILPGFLPPLPPLIRKDGKQGQSSLKGYAYLLSKTIPKEGLLEICWKQWAKGKLQNRFLQEKNKVGIDNLKGKIGLDKDDKVNKDEELIDKYNEMSGIIKTTGIK